MSGPVVGAETVGSIGAARVMATQPNILWILTDEQRTDRLACYGSSWARTPHLDSLAESGVRFDNAYTPSPVCVPARASMLTARSCSEIGVLNNHHQLPSGGGRLLTCDFARAGKNVQA